MSTGDRCQESLPTYKRLPDSADAKLKGRHPSMLGQQTLQSIQNVILATPAKLNLRAITRKLHSALIQALQICKSIKYQSPAEKAASVFLCKAV